MENGGTRSTGRHDSIIEKCQHVCSFEGANLHTAQWLSWLERRPVTAEVVGSNPIRVVFCLIKQSNNLRRGLSSAGRAPALQAGGHRFEPCRPHQEYGWIPERPKGADCKSVVDDFEGSNPSPPTSLRGYVDVIDRRRCGSIGRAADL